MTNGCEKNRENGVKKAKYGEFLKLNMGKNTILSFFPHIKEAWISVKLLIEKYSFDFMIHLVVFPAAN